ncbi:Gfo/Idh/MocA family oxidoreductase [Streptomyces sp. NPDC051773]|uniref:Gfo/Idh/MocA family protein n=1 Tax=Streptomyces sp. NPDC051773 TaxID=3156682 RepID=UPI0034121EE0
MVNLRAAIVGCGRITSTDHAFAQAADPRVHLAAVVDPDHDRARTLARRFGAREVFTSLEEMLATTDVDLVSLCAPPHLLVPLATTALRADCHVLCERPDTTEPAGLARLATLAAARHRVLTFGFPYRHLTEARTARDLLAVGHIGEIHDVQLTARGCHESHTGRGSGPLSDAGIHLLDLALWITGFPEAIDTLLRVETTAMGPAPTTAKTTSTATTTSMAGTVSMAATTSVASAESRSVSTGPGAVRGIARVGERTTALIRCRDGTSVSISTSYVDCHDDEEILRVRLLGDRGSLELFPLSLSHPNLPAPGHIRPPLSGRPRDHRLAHRRQTAAVVDACLGRGPVPVTVAEAHHVQDIVDRLRRSSARAADQATGPHEQPYGHGGRPAVAQPSSHHAAHHPDTSLTPCHAAHHPDTPLTPCHAAHHPDARPTSVDDDLVQEASHG